MTVHRPHPPVRAMRENPDIDLDPNERMQLGQLEEQTFSSGGPLAWAERRHHAGIASILRQRGAGR